MQIGNLLLVLSSVITGALVSAGRNYNARAERSLVEANSLYKRELECQGWSPLPPKASYSQCLLALGRIVKQPQTCAQKYMAGVARSIYDPIYNWFGVTVDVDPTWVVQVAAQFAINNAVEVLVIDAFHNVVAHVNSDGAPVLTPPSGSLGTGLARTWALNYPTYLIYGSSDNGSIVQNIWSARAQLLTIILSKPLELLPVVC